MEIDSFGLAAFNSLNTAVIVLKEFILDDYSEGDSDEFTIFKLNHYKKTEMKKYKLITNTYDELQLIEVIPPNGIKFVKGK